MDNVFRVRLYLSTTGILNVGRPPLKGFNTLKIAGLIFTAALQGCVSSAFPLLDNKTIVIDSSLTGRYVLHDMPKAKLDAFDLYLKGNEYLVVENSKIVYLATLHQRHPGTYLVQLRAAIGPSDSSKPSPYAYMLVKKTDNGFNLNLIQCETSDDCEVKSHEELEKLADAAEQHPQQNQLSTAIRIAGLGE